MCIPNLDYIFEIIVFVQDVLGCTTEMDFFLWPRNDIEKIECLLFSRWKGEDEVFKPLQVQSRLLLNNVCILNTMFKVYEF